MVETTDPLKFSPMALVRNVRRLELELQLFEDDERAN